MIWNPFRRRRDRRDTPGNAGPASDSTAPATATEEAPPPAGPAAAPAGATTPDTADAPAPTVPDRPVGQIEHDIINVLRTIYDPEVPVDIYELGLIYGIEIGDDRHVDIRMTLTSPACPVAGSLPPEVEHKVAGVEGVRSVTIDLTWDPPWGPDRMSEAARLQLGL